MQLTETVEHIPSRNHAILHRVESADKPNLLPDIGLDDFFRERKHAERPSSDGGCSGHSTKQIS